MSSPTAVGFYLEHAGGAKLTQCVIEGSQCDIGMHLLGNTGPGFSSGRDCYIDQPWGECGSINTMVRIQLDKSDVVISRMRIQSNQDAALAGAYIDAKGSRRCHISVEKTRWEELVGTFGSFYADDQVPGQFTNQWSFRDNTINGINMLTSDDKWAAGTQPASTVIETGTFNYG